MPRQKHRIRTSAHASATTEFARPPVLLVLSLVIALYVACACAYNFITPAAGEHNPDETAHLLYVQSIADGHLPVFQAGQNNYEAHQPPLYYILCAPVYLAARGQGADFAVHAVRCVSTIFGAILIIITFLCVRTLFPDSPSVAIGTAAFVAFLPMNVSLCASVSNDPLLNLLIGTVLWQLALLVRAAANDAPQGRRFALNIALVLGLGLWTKSSMLLLVPVVMFALYSLAKERFLAPTLALRLLAGIVALSLLIASPWLARNQILYGDPFAQHLFETSFTNTAQAPDLIRYVFHGSMTGYLAGVARWTFASFWGVFDSMRLFWGQDPLSHAPSPAASLLMPYLVLEALSLAALLRLILLLRGSSLPLARFQAIILQSFVILVIATGLAHLRFVLVFFQAQGRYWYPSLVPLALFFVLGLWGRPSPRRAENTRVAVMALLLLALNAYTLAGLLSPRYHGE